MVLSMLCSDFGAAPEVMLASLRILSGQNQRKMGLFFMAIYILGLDTLTAFHSKTTDGALILTQTIVVMRKVGSSFYF